MESPWERAAATRGRVRSVRPSVYEPPSRKSVTVETPSLATGASWQGRITLAPSYRLYRIVTSQAARVRVYVNADSQSSDLSRAEGTDPAEGAGVVLEYITASGLLDAYLSPAVDGFAASASVPITVTNNGSSGAVQVRFVFIAVEE